MLGLQKRLCNNWFFEFYNRYLSESASWLLNEERYEESAAAIERVAHINGKPVPDNLIERLKVSVRNVVVSLTMSAFLAKLVMT